MIGIGSFIGFPGLYSSTAAEPNPNLLFWSEQFQESSWTPTLLTVTEDSTASPVNDMTADLLVGTSLEQVFSGTIQEGETYTASVYIKAGPDNVGGLTNLFLDSGGDSDSALIETPINWTRISTSIVAQPGDTSISFIVFPDISGEGFSTYFWGAKLELGNLTEYVKREGA